MTPTLSCSVPIDESCRTGDDAWHNTWPGVITASEVHNGQQTPPGKKWSHENVLSTLASRLALRGLKLSPRRWLVEENDAVLFELTPRECY